MALSCGEVMYGAYYPYLYGRGAARSFHHAPPHFQYDRLNVQSGGSGGGGGGGGGGEAYGAGGGGGGGGALSSGSASSGAHSPASPPHAHLHAPAARLRAKEEDLSAHSRHSNDGGGSSESEGECGAAGGGAAGAGRGARAQYVSANCVVFTHYSGDVAAVVDDHFTRALALDKHKESVPMVSRNLPASFFNAALVGGAGGGGGCGGGGAGVDIYEYDPWQAHYGGYGHAAHRHAAEYHAAAAAATHHNMAAAGYGGLLLPRSMHHQYKPVEWAQHHAPLDPAACASYSYPPVHGLEAPVQDTSKDLYWF